MLGFGQRSNPHRQAQDAETRSEARSEARRILSALLTSASDTPESFNHLGGDGIPAGEFRLRISLTLETI